MRRRLSLLACAALVGGAVAFPLGVLASHRFTDVPTSHTFHNDIDAIADVGVTQGCGATTYCPDAFVTRGQMAAFLNRLGALAPGRTPVVNATRLDGIDSSQFARKDQVVAGTYNCAGHTMTPGHPDYAYVTQQNAIWLATPGSIAVFHCPVHLPDGATVTELRTGLRDTTADGSLGCELYGYSSLAHGGETQLAFVTSSLANMPGDTILEDSTISSAVIDNDEMSYSVKCTLFGAADSAELALFGVTIAYETSGIPVD